MTSRTDGSFRSDCLSLDLEVDRNDRIHKFGAVRGDTGYEAGGGGSPEELTRLDALAEGISFLLGHNLIAFDLPRLKAAKPDLRLLDLPAIDTLRLSPLAFPRKPYHRLVKHYKDGGLVRRRTNDPVLDARLALKVFGEQREALGKATPDLLAAWHWLTTPEPCGVDRAVDRLFAALRGAPRPAEDEVHSAIRRLLDGRACATHTREVCRDAASAGWALGYALAWLSVDQELDAARTRESVMPPWVLHNVPKAPQLLRRLRDTVCADSTCGWCRAHHDARREMKRWFGFKDFRPEPADSDGHPMQQSIVEEAMAGGHALGILPTGTGKSLCYQLPAISRYDKTGALTVVISPLVALMADQVAGLEARGIECCVTVNGMLSMPERAVALERVRLGGAGILLIAPEQLRSRSLRRALDQREIGGWVVDEAHCLSSWGHDFRPDYRYVSRFIRERKKARSEPIPPLLCLTATATPQVRDDIVHHFEEKLRIDLAVFDGGAKRRNLSYEVIDVTGGEKLARVHQVLESHLSHAVGGAIVYCATRRASEKVAKFCGRRAPLPSTSTRARCRGARRTSRSASSTGTCA